MMLSKSQNHNYQIKTCIISSSQTNYSQASVEKHCKQNTNLSQQTSKNCNAHPVKKMFSARFSLWNIPLAHSSPPNIRIIWSRLANDSVHRFFFCFQWSVWITDTAVILFVFFHFIILYIFRLNFRFSDLIF